MQQDLLKISRFTQTYELNILFEWNKEKGRVNYKKTSEKIIKKLS